MNKTIISGILTLTLAASFVSCGDVSDSSSKKREGTTITTTVTEETQLPESDVSTNDENSNEIIIEDSVVSGEQGSISNNNEGELSSDDVKRFFSGLENGEVTLQDFDQIVEAFNTSGRPAYPLTGENLNNYGSGAMYYFTISNQSEPVESSNGEYWTVLADLGEDGQFPVIFGTTSNTTFEEAQQFVSNNGVYYFASADSSITDDNTDMMLVPMIAGNNEIGFNTVLPNFQTLGLR